jgi:hypothetical protein
MAADRLRPSQFATTGIGSLPHTQLEMAIQAAFQVDVPYAPQLPRQNPAEFMVPQALERLPGLIFDGDGAAVVDVEAWRRGSTAFGKALDAAIEGNAPEPFEPGPDAYRAWKPFLWEVEHRKLALAKAQLAGPATVRWVVKVSDGRTLASEPELERQCHRLVWARLIAMARAIRRVGAEPLLFLDEPGLYALDRTDPKHLVMLQELRLMVMALRKEGALVGLHCCGDTDWQALLGLGLDYLSMDARLSLDHVVEHRAEFAAFAAAGGALAVGLIPTNVDASYALTDLVSDALTAGAQAPGAVGRFILTPACGLAMRSPIDAEKTFADLRSAQKLLAASVRTTRN